MMYEIKDVYLAFRKAESINKHRPYRVPNDFDKFFETRSKKLIQAYTLITMYFNTKWSTIDPFDYFTAGFTLYKTFSYIRFFKPRILQLYIQNDKNKKRLAILNKKKIIKSAKYMIGYMKENNIPSVQRYCLMESGGYTLPVRHYIGNSIDIYFIVFLIKSGFLRLKDSEIPYIPYIVQNKSEIYFLLDGMKDFTDKLKELILEKTNNEKL